MRLSIARLVVLFVGLALAAAVLLIVAAAIGDAYARDVLLALAAALFGAGLTVFLLRVTSPATA